MEPHVINEIVRPPQELIKGFADFDSATIHEASGGKGALSSEIKPIDPSSRLCGPAVTVKCRPGDNLMFHKAIYVAGPGDVLVITTGSYTEAGPWGEVMTFAAQVRGIAGMVMDGSVRDSRAIIDMGFPMFTRSLCIKGTTKDSLGLINYPIFIGGITVNPGDLVFGDADGVVIVAREEIATVLAACKARVEKEKIIMEKLKKGETTLELYGFNKSLEAKGLKEK